LTEKRLPELRIHEILPSGDMSISPQFIGVLSKISSVFETPDDAFSTIGNEALRSILEETDPTLVGYLKEGKEKLDGDPGFFVLKRTGIDHLKLPLAQFTAIAVSSFFGLPTKPSPRSQVIAWPIDYTAETGTPGVTFSQTNSEATMHTDTQYSPEPEPYFGLFCLRPANDGGGCRSSLIAK
jgi:hypothetical protein